MTKRIIGISGNAGSGKDLLFSLLQRQIPNLQRFALADALKQELQSFLIKYYNIDIFNCTREEKNIVRPILVAHGGIRRKFTQGKCWTDILTPQINAFLKQNPEGVACITDIRYSSYEKDEVYWLKEVMGGFLVHITLYENFGGKSFLTLPANQDEAENEPKLISAADYHLKWTKVLSPLNPNPDLSTLMPYAKDCAAKFNES